MRRQDRWIEPDAHAGIQGCSDLRVFLRLESRAPVRAPYRAAGTTGCVHAVSTSPRWDGFGCGLEETIFART